MLLVGAAGSSLRLVRPTGRGGDLLCGDFGFFFCALHFRLVSVLAWVWELPRNFPLLYLDPFEGDVLWLPSIGTDLLGC